MPEFGEPQDQSDFDMPECTPQVNPDWEPETLAEIAAWEDQGVYYSYDQKGIIDTRYKLIKSVPYEYIVVAGTPSEELVSGRKEIAPGNSVTDSRLYQKTAYLLTFRGTSHNGQGFTQTRDDVAETDTVTFADPDVFSVGTIITIHAK